MTRVRIPRREFLLTGLKPLRTIADLEAWANRVSRSREGSDLRTYLADSGELARDVFRAARLSPDPVGTRCTQIIDEFQKGTVEAMPPQGQRRYAQLLRQQGQPKALSQAQITGPVYCAAQLLFALDGVDHSDPPAVLASYCMKVERWRERLIYTLALSDVRPATARRSKNKTTRVETLRQYVKRNGRPKNDKQTRVKLGYPEGPKGRVMLTRDLAEACAKLP